MPAALSMDIGERVAAALREGPTTRAAAGRFMISISSAVRVGQRDHAGISQEPREASGHRRSIPDGPIGTWLLARLAEMPDLTMAALTAELAKRGVHVVITTVWRFVKRAGHTFKKKSLVASERSRPDVKGARDVWQDYFMLLAWFNWRLNRNLAMTEQKKLSGRLSG